MRYIQRFAMAMVVLVALAGLAACGTISHEVARDGSGAQQLVWPAPDDVTPLHEGGTWPAPADLRKVQTGLTQDQVIALIGPPHFHEGAWGVREWDYLFHLHDARTGTDRLCQYKILFDTDHLARSFYWKPQDCADLVHPAPKATPEPEQEVFTLSADALFGFDSHRLGTKGKAALDVLARKILARQKDVRSIRIIGYTDMLGSKSYNGLLSQQRAHAVLQYLRGQGVPGGLMTAVGLGEGDPVTTACTGRKGHAAQVACLAPDRRVEVKVYGKP